ncbi:MAG TPA: helix-turn-helix domain-containing protein [Anoxybacillus sp.]|jgi:transcriptional regulator with XRE-family HTH domain|nr:helix-turn-helix domain-containing protein [Anoxybacillus sp.]
MISKRLSKLRKTKNWSLQYTANRLGIAKSTYAGYESGYRQPSLDALKELAVLFETSVDYLLGMTETYASERDTIELTSKDILSQISLTIDEKSLSQDELNQFIAFIRLKREMEAK